VTIERLNENWLSMSALAEECRNDANAAALNPAYIERALGATIEEAIVVVANALQDARMDQQLARA
jgi:hypothetical protein